MLVVMLIQRYWSLLQAIYVQCTLFIVHVETWILLFTNSFNKCILSRPIICLRFRWFERYILCERIYRSSNKHKSMGRGVGISTYVDCRDSQQVTIYYPVYLFSHNIPSKVLNYNKIIIVKHPRKGKVSLLMYWTCGLCGRPCGSEHHQ